MIPSTKALHNAFVIGLNQETGNITVFDDNRARVLGSEPQTPTDFSGNIPRVATQVKKCLRWQSLHFCALLWRCSLSRLIDCFLVESPVTSLAMSPIADFLVTTHVDDLGVYLW